MPSTIDDLHHWMTQKEDEHLEFKEAKGNFHFEKLVKYCAALANEGGGRMILGVTNARPRKVVGSTAFREIERTTAGLIDKLRLRVEAEEIPHPDGRVIAFHVPSRPIGMPVAVDGAYWMRGGEALVSMTPDRLKRIFAEAGPDLSAELRRGAGIGDLDPRAIAELRRLWRKKSGNADLDAMSDEQLLADAELVVDGIATYAALILLGSHSALGRNLPQSEVIFEYRSADAAVESKQREEFREGFLLFMDRIWQLIDLRNDKLHFQDGLFIWDVPTFNESVVREAVLNAVGHRDYRLQGSVFVRQFPTRLEIVSPGGLPAGITPENILDRQQPRNRRLATALALCGLIERSGQGADRMFRESIKEGKPTPDFTGTDAFQVEVTLRGEIADPRFLRFLERVGSERLASFTTADFLVLDLVHREQPVPAALQSRIAGLAEQGVIERIGRGRGTRYLLSRRFHTALGQAGAFTRRRGLDRETNKELLVRHLADAASAGSPMSELQQVLPSQSRSQVKGLLMELRDARRVRLEGTRRWARWFVAGSADYGSAATPRAKEEP